MARKLTPAQTALILTARDHVRKVVDEIWADVSTLDLTDIALVTVREVLGQIVEENMAVEDTITIEA